MSLKDETDKLVAAKKSELAKETSSKLSLIERSRIRVIEIQPLLQELSKSIREGLICIEIKENWCGNTTAVIITLGKLKLHGKCTSPDNMLPIGRGALWYFFPCYDVEGKENWSFNDHKIGHKWFETIEELFKHITPRVAEEIAKYE